MLVRRRYFGERPSAHGLQVNERLGERMVAPVLPYQRTATMLRITTHDDEDAFTFEVEGRLIGVWAKELERAWECAMPAFGEKSRVVDLTGVLFIDEEGIRVLNKLCREGARFRTAGLLNSAIVAEIRLNRKPPLENLS